MPPPQIENQRSKIENPAKPQILDWLVEDLHRRGVVGEDRALKLLYLVFTSRLLDTPVSVILKGPSSAGKSFILQRILEYFPPSAYYSLSSMSRHALIYDREPLQHRMLVLNEEKGLQGKLTAYLLRSILSEGRVRYAAIRRSKNGATTSIIEREGPTGLVTTTTDVDLTNETETRMLSIPVLDGSHQTRDILAAIARQTNPPEVGPAWLNFQCWLEIRQRDVYVPYADKLMALIRPISVRLRRDAKCLLALIQTHALVHQEYRERDSDGRILAIIDDYGAVRELIEDLVSDAAEGAVPNDVREVVTMAGIAIFADHAPTTIQALARAMRLDKSTVSRRVQKAISMGFLCKTNAGQRTRGIMLGDPLPNRMSLLPQPTEIPQPPNANAQPPSPDPNPDTQRSGNTATPQHQPRSGEHRNTPIH